MHEHYAIDEYDVSIPLVRTPSVVDLPLSTFPTTAQRTSDVKATLGDGSRSSSAIRAFGFE